MKQESFLTSKDRWIIFIFIIITSFIIIGACMVANMAVNEAEQQYTQPDTTITIHNSKPDTIITKKKLPFWLK